MNISTSVDLTVDPSSSHWLERTLTLLRDEGFAIVLDIVSEEELERTRAGFERVETAQRADVPEAAIQQARERGDRDLRLLFKYDAFFYRFLEYPQTLEVLDAFLSPTAILRFQQGSVFEASPSPRRPGPWHMNFRRVMNGYHASLEVGFAIDGILPGQYHFALGSHQQIDTPAHSTLDAMTQTFEVPAGAMFVFDGTLWHREWNAEPGIVRRMVMQQFVPHFIKPHIDYVRALGASAVQALPARTRRILGWESRVPASLAEFYVDPADRSYLPDQG